MEILALTKRCFDCRKPFVRSHGKTPKGFTYIEDGVQITRCRSCKVIKASTQLPLRAVQIAELLAQDMKSTEIASYLNIDLSCVHKWQVRIREHFDTKTITGAILEAVRQGVITV